MVAPKANLLLVEANTASYSDLMTAVDTARNSTGVSVVSMSWGGNEWAGCSTYDPTFTTPSGHNGVTFVASSGDSGAASWRLLPGRLAERGGRGRDNTLSSNGVYGSESGWTFRGGGISHYYSQPNYQKGVVTQSNSARTVPDVAMDANPSSGVPVYDNYDNGAEYSLAAGRRHQPGCADVGRRDRDR